MSTVQHLESAIRKLSEVELAEFRNWFVQFDAETWDREIEADAASGHLDALADAALREFRNGKCRPR